MERVGGPEDQDEGEGQGQDADVEEEQRAGQDQHGGGEQVSPDEGLKEGVPGEGGRHERGDDEGGDSQGRGDAHRQRGVSCAAGDVDDHARRDGRNREPLQALAEEQASVRRFANQLKERFGHAELYRLQW